MTRPGRHGSVEDRRGTRCLATAEPQANAELSKRTGELRARPRPLGGPPPSASVSETDLCRPLILKAAASAQFNLLVSFQPDLLYN